MKLLEALEIVRGPQPSEAKPFALCLVCGFNPLHLQTFLNAEVRRRMGRKPEIHAGLYGDFWGNLDHAREMDRDVVVISAEWADLDPRLGIRSLGSWAPSVLPEIVETARRRGEQLTRAALSLAEHSPVVISLPTLPLPPAAFTPGWRASALELELKSGVAGLAASLARLENVRVLSQLRLDELSPLAERTDVRSDVTTGFPYQLKHASIMAELLCRLFADETPKKGLITDLDDTLWRGILGEDGPEGVSWDLDHHSHMHGVYQQFLRSLSEAGTLIGVASKNDPGLVAKAFRRSDILLPQERVFPLEVHWGAKSKSVARILKAWNIGADDVVFIDDSPAELAEVQSAHPGIEAMAFPTQEPQQVLQLCQRLRDLFGKNSIAEEDALRLQSLRQPLELAEDNVNLTGSPDSFLQQAEAELSLNYAKEPLDPRAFELVNKTNQFNLNGQRYTFAELQKHALSPNTFFLVASYRDKYGPLGKIAVITGRQQDCMLLLDNWVMSCRAFGRRIEYACLEALYNKYGAAEIEFAFVATDRNGPMKAFLQEILGAPPGPGSRLSRNQFQERRLETFHAVVEMSNG
jgi:FkbH-like protein